MKAAPLVFFVVWRPSNALPPIRLTTHAEALMSGGRLYLPGAAAVAQDGKVELELRAREHIVFARTLRTTRRTLGPCEFTVAQLSTPDQYELPWHRATVRSVSWERAKL